MSMAPITAIVASETSTLCWAAAPLALLDVGLGAFPNDDGIEDPVSVGPGVGVTTVGNRVRVFKPMTCCEEMVSTMTMPLSSVVVRTCSTDDANEEDLTAQALMVVYAEPSADKVVAYGVKIFTVSLAMIVTAVVMLVSDTAFQVVRVRAAVPSIK